MIYKVETRFGWLVIPEKIAGYSFPMSFGGCVGATEFSSKLFANKTIKSFKLDKAPHWAHVEEFKG